MNQRILILDDTREDYFLLENLIRENRPKYDIDAVTHQFFPAVFIISK